MRTTRRIIPFALLSGLLLSCGSEHRLARVRISQPGVREATTDTACKVPEQIAWTDDKGERHIVYNPRKLKIGRIAQQQRGKRFAQRITLRLAPKANERLPAARCRGYRDFRSTGHAL